MCGHRTINQISVVLCCMYWSRPLLTACLTQTGHLWAVQSSKEGVWGVGKGFLLLGCLPAQWLPACNTTQLSHAEPLVGLWLGGTNSSIWKGWPKGGLAHGWLLHTVIICLSPSLPPPPPLSVSLSSVCKPCCDHCSDRRKRLFVQDPATCRCSCKHTDEYCKERQQELNERTCKYVGEDSHSGTITSKQDS